MLSGRFRVQTNFKNLAKICMWPNFCFLFKVVDSNLTDLLLYGSESFNRISNDLILNETINFIFKSERFTINFIFKSERFKTLEAYSQS